MTDLQSTLLNLVNKTEKFKVDSYPWGWTIVIPARGNRAAVTMEFTPEQQLDLNLLEHRLWQARGYEPHYLIELTRDELITLYDKEFNR